MDEATILHLVSLHLRHKWAMSRGDYLIALQHMEHIMALNFDALQAAAEALVAQDHADAAAVTAAEASVNDAQAKVDAITATLTAAITPVAPVEAAPVDAAPIA